MRTLLISVLCFCFVASQVITQRYYMAGNFKGVNPLTKTSLSCYDNTAKRWSRQNFAHPAGAYIFEESLSYAFSQGQILLHDGGSYFAFNTQNGVLVNQQSATTVTTGTVSRFLVNKKRTILYVLGTFTKIGANVIPAFSASTARIAAFDITTTKANGTLLTLSAPSVNFTSINFNKAWTQGDNLVIEVVENTRSRLYRVGPNSPWTALTDAAQNTVALNFKKSTADDSLYTYSTVGTLSSAPSVATLYLKLDATGTTWTQLVSSDTTSNPTKPIHPTLWTPGAAGEMYFVYNNPQITNGSSEALTISQERLTQYIYRHKEVDSSVAMVTPNGRLASTNYPVSFTFTAMSTLLNGMFYDDTSKFLIVTGNNVAYFVIGPYQSRVASSITGRIAEDRTLYNARLVSTGAAAMTIAQAGTDNAVFTTVFNGGMNTYANLEANFVPTTGSLTCFSGARVVYDVGAVGVASFERNGAWGPVQGISDSMEADVVNGVATPRIFAIERLSGALSADAFFAGSFRTIGGNVYNSIVKYTIDSNGIPTLTALGSGVRAFSTLGDPTSGGTQQSDADLTRYYDMQPGAVTFMLYDQGSQMLYVSGAFDRAGTVSTNNLARWNDKTQSWSSIGSITGNIQKMVMFNNNLVVAGTITQANQTTVSNIAMFNIGNNTWMPFGQGLSSYTDMIVYSGKLYVVGSANGRLNSGSANSFAVWNPSTNSWNTIGTKISQSMIEADTCTSGVLSCDVSAASLHIVGNRLYATRNQNGGVFVLNNDAFERVSELGATQTSMFIRNGFDAGTRVSVYTAGGSTSVYMEPNTGSSWFYNYDRTDTAIADGTVVIFSSASTACVSIVLMVLALALLLL